MNKQKFIEELEEELKNIKWDERDDNYNAFSNGKETAFNISIDLAKQLDEPKKVIFSYEEKFVADWLDDLRGQISDVKLNSGALFMTFIGRQLERYYDEDYSLITYEVEAWLVSAENKVKMMNAINNGYEVKKEQLYYVVFDILHLQKYLVKNVKTNQFYLSNNENVISNYEQVQFTEQEIKDIGQGYWQFKKKVEDE